MRLSHFRPSMQAIGSMTLEFDVLTLNSFGTFQPLNKAHVSQLIPSRLYDTSLYSRFANSHYCNLYFSPQFFLLTLDIELLFTPNR